MKIAFLLILSLLFMAMKNEHLEKTKGSTDIIADTILQKMSYKLNSLKNIRYDIKRELNYSSENYHNETNWTAYFDFQSADTIIGFKYQIDDSTLKQIFNGTEAFTLDKKSRTIRINEQPDRKSLSSLSPFYNSIITLKNVLTLIINDKTIAKTIADTTVNNTSCYLVNFNISKRRIQNLGKGFDVMTTKSNFIYKIIIDKNNNLPLEVLQVNDIDNDFIKTSFSNFTADVKEPSELSWYYSTYADEYKPAKGKETSKLISVGSIAPDWTLPVYNKNENVSLSHLRGNVILLDFWIKNCGPCIQSIPYLNSLQQKLRNKKFEILGINSYDPKNDIAWFCNKYKTTYKVLMNGKDIAEKYGVSGFPRVVLIDKEGKVFYAGDFDQAKIERLIETSL